MFLKYYFSYVYQKMFVLSSIQTPLAMVQEFLENMQQELLLPTIFVHFYLVLMKKTAVKIKIILFPSSGIIRTFWEPLCF